MKRRVSEISKEYSKEKNKGERKTVYFARGKETVMSLEISKTSQAVLSVKLREKRRRFNGAIWCFDIRAFEF
jgi:hypothetical protein